MTPLTQKQQKIMALLALAAQSKKEEIKQSIDIEEILHYCNNELDNQQAQQFRAKILNNEEAYEVWMLLEENRELWADLDTITQPKKTAGFTALVQWFIKPIPLTGMATAMSVLVISLIILQGQNKLELNDSYEMAALYPNTSFDFSIQGQVKGLTVFVDSKKKAFKQGVLDSINKIQQKSLNQPQNCLNQLESCQTEADYYYYIGAWSILTKVACQQNAADLYQNQQILIKRWHQQAQKVILMDKTGLNIRLNQLYQQAENPHIQTAFCSANNELLSFTMF